ncbi:hypothetical protein D6U78_09445 [Vibrio cholerae]|nr:hypothetical protein [Vibrio cholerae]MVF55111.1 hypothetical protein [Vibrio cholerae]
MEGNKMQLDHIELETKSDFELELTLHVLLTGRKPLKEASPSQRIYLAASEDGSDQCDIVPVPRYCNDYNETMQLAFDHFLSIRYLDDCKCWVVDQVLTNQFGVYATYSESRIDKTGEMFQQTKLRMIVLTLIKIKANLSSLKLAHLRYLSAMNVGS